jgi:hypothetical protein
MACISLKGIDASAYFRTGIYTHLCLQEPTLDDQGQTLVTWQYTFRDLGMDHTIEKEFIVLPVPGGAYLVKDTSDSQEDPWHLAEDYKACCDALLDHYRPFLKTLYKSLGIDTMEDNKASLSCNTEHDKLGSQP